MQRVLKETNFYRTVADGLRNMDGSLAQAAREILFYQYKYIRPGGVFQNFGCLPAVCVESSYRYYSKVILLSLSLNFHNEVIAPRIIVGTANAATQILYFTVLVFHYSCGGFNTPTLAS